MKELEKLILDILHICGDYTKKTKRWKKVRERMALKKGRQVQDMFNHCQIYFHDLVVVF